MPDHIGDVLLTCEAFIMQRDPRDTLVREKEDMMRMLVMSN